MSVSSLSAFGGLGRRRLTLLCRSAFDVGTKRTDICMAPDHVGGAVAEFKLKLRKY